MRTRRELLLGGAALGAGLMLPSSSRASVSAEDRKFVFVWASGGWDPTKVFMASFADTIHRVEGDEPVTYGNFRIVTNPERPAVDTFYANNHQRLVTLDGMLIRSINHPICRNLWMTNTPNAGRPDWPSTIGYRSADRYPVPHMVVQGYSMAGQYSAYTAVSGGDGQLQQLVSGSGNLIGSQPYAPPPLSIQQLMDQFAANRAVQRAGSTQSDKEAFLAESYKQAAQRMIDFKDRVAGEDLSTGTSLTDQIPLAMAYLSSGVARCVTMSESANGTWDSHVDNSAQSPAFQKLFTGLNALCLALATTPGKKAATLAEETVVVVFSEMGRTPFLNSTGGKDHWMYSTAMMWGSGIAGGRPYGAFNDVLNGMPLDLATGELRDSDAGGVAMTPDVLGSTLMTLAGIDPASELETDTTLNGMLA